MVKIYIKDINYKNIIKNEIPLRKYLKNEYFITKLQTQEDNYWIDNNNNIYFYESLLNKELPIIHYNNINLIIEYSKDFKINVFSQLPVNYKILNLKRFIYQYNNMKLIIEGVYEKDLNINFKKKTLLDIPDLIFNPTNVFLEYTEHFIENKECLKKSFKKSFEKNDFDISNPFIQDQLNVFLFFLI
jgi:hypothetical protein